MGKLKIVIGGFIGLYPTGGVTWDYIQYVLGFKLLGHEVYYIEDTGQYSSYRINEKKAWDDPTDTIEYLKQTMERFGFTDKWAYRDTFSGKNYGMSLKKVIKICLSADIFINISDATIYREEYLNIPKRILIDSDPMFTQLQANEASKADKRYPVKRIKITDYNYHFTFGENIGAPDCRIPTLNLEWLPTRQPICLQCWENKSNIVESTKSFTTIMNWATRSKLKFENEEWGQKDVEFQKFIRVPQLFSQKEFNIVLAVSAPFKEEINTALIKNYGWNILDPSLTVATAKDYQSFIANSGAEFSVAKETYVKSNSGWFSCRSACYLASGRPVITQETGWSKFIPAGLGLFAFSDMQSALEAFSEVDTNMSTHSKAAKEIATECFDSNKVLKSLIDAIN